MRYRVLSHLHSRGFLTTALLIATGITAGCSADAIRLNDGFYTGAMPQATNTQVAAATQNYPGNLDRTMTGSISPAQAAAAARAGGGYASSQPMPPRQPQYAAASTAQVQRGQLPPPPAPNYQRTQPQNVFGGTAAGSASSTSTPSSAQPQTAMSPTRGTPPSTLGEQARRIASPAQRPNASAAETASNNTGSTSTVTVKSGDTLSEIARRSGVSANAIRQANNMSGDTVRLGQRLVVPTGRPITDTADRQVASVSDAPKPYVKPDRSSAAQTQKTARLAEKPTSKPEATTPPAAKETRVAKAETQSSVGEQSGTSAEKAPQASGIGGYRWPVQGRVLQRFGEKVGSKRNDGLNISVPRGTPVKAAENGVVIYAGDGLKEFGNTVLVKHDDGLVTVYGHADVLKVKRGDTVKRGQQIANSGMSGDTDVPQLHFEVRKNSAPIDPTQYLQ